MIPDRWKRKNLGEVITLQRGFDLPEQDRIHGTIPIISSSGITGFHNESKVSPPGIVTGRYGTIGKVFLVDVDFWPLNTSLWVKDFYGNDHRYVYYLLQSIDYKKLSDKTGVPGINRNDVHKLRVLLPPLLEQCRIAEVLGAWDESIDLLEKLIGRVRSRKQWLMQQLLTGKKRFEEFEGSEWRTIVFNQIIDKCFDYRGRTPLKIGMEWGDGNIPALSASNVRMGKIDFDRECYFASPELYKKWMTQGDLEKGDVLLTTEAPLGTVAQVPDNELYILSQRVIAIRPKSALLDKSFLFHFMRSKEFQDELDKNSSGSTAKGIQRKRLEKIIIKIPSLPEQEKIAAVLSAADEEISTLEKQLAAYKQQKLGLMQQLLTGKIRVGMS